MLHYLWLLPVGLAIGAFGTLIGAGGGFLLVPLLVLVYPDEPREIITSISLAVVFFNALSGSVSYARMKRIDYRSSLIFATATIPGAVLGALSTSWIPRHVFDMVLAVALLALAIFLIRETPGKEGEPIVHPAGRTRRTIVEADGTRHEYSFNQGVGIALSVLVGYLSSLLGIGGGIIHVPVLAHLLNFPVHIATATSHLILAIMAAAGTAVHIATGAFHHGVRRTIVLGIGVLLGAPIGARFSSRIHGKWILRGLSLALALVALRLLMMAN